MNRRAMMEAIREAAAESILFKGSSLTDGLRCIRTFERVNGCAFDPTDPSHRAITASMGFHEALNRKLARIAQIPGGAIMTTPISEIAERLSLKQRRLLRAMPKRRAWKWWELCGDEFEQLPVRLTELTLTGYEMLTPLGLSVKDYLEKGDR